MFDDSVLIVAHPDDEILWLGSVLDKVDSIIFCFNDDPSKPEVGPARKRTIEEYPLSNVTSLDLIEPGIWNSADWNMPVAAEYGIKVVSREIESSCQDIFEKLKHALRFHVANSKNIFTHNPWGEYGHEEHVLVHRVLKTLQAEFHYDLWYSNYCSNHSVNFMDTFISGFVTDYRCFPVNQILATSICQIYKKHGCWTWYGDYQWFEQECLMRDKPLIRELDLQDYGRFFPVNYIKINVETLKPKRHSMGVIDMAIMLKRRMLLWMK